MGRRMRANRKKNLSSQYNEFFLKQEARERFESPGPHLPGTPKGRRASRNAERKERGTR